MIKKYIILFAAIACFFTITVHAQDAKTLDAYSKSYSYEAAKRYHEAAAIFITAYDTNSYEMNLRLGYLYYLLGRNNLSIVYYKRAAFLMPNAQEPLWGLINPLAVQENWKEVEKIYYTILKSDPLNVTANYYLGCIFYYRQDYVKAKKHFDITNNQYPFKYGYLVMGGWTNYFLGNKKDAQELFGKALQFNPNDSSALEGLSLVK
jgi:tetratricopeptide (TPR) repeat protein